MQLIKWFWKEAQAWQGHLILALFLIPVVQGFRVIQPWFIQKAVDLAEVPDSTQQILDLAFWFLMLIIANHLAQYWQGYLTGIAGCNIVRSIRSKVYAHLISLPYAWFHGIRSGQMVVRLGSDVEAVQNVLSGSLIRLISDTLAVFGILAMMFWLDLRLAFLVTLSMPLLIVLTSWLGKKMQRGYLLTKKLMSQLATSFTEILEGGYTIRGFAREKGVNHDFFLASRELTEANHRLNRLEPTYFSLVEFFSSLLLALILFDGVKQLSYGGLTFGELVAFIAFVHRLMTPIRHLSGFFSEVLNALTSMKRIYEILQVEPEKEDREFLGRSPKKFDIVFDRVNFGYGEEPVLKNMSFSIKAGEKIAIVGRTGAGKSTLVRLLNRFYSPQSGAIRIGGIPIEQISRQELRASIGFVLQDVYLFSGTLLQNLSMFERARNQGCIQYAEAVFSEGLMPGISIDSPITQGGGNFSTGERQLISFGRVFQKDSAIFLLDEATANLDMLTEGFLQHRLEKFMQGKTALIIAHRLATIKAVDKILVLKQGQVVESGTYEELIAAKKEFWEYFRNQYVDLLDSSSPNRPQ
ncbi:MAG: ABC transporter ATP-binding protein [Candidatus Cloacimonetes bacterium]|nr:ABC transporter ATP-binding protein [Candidatus Cloacimonadota bacterium]